MGLFLCPKVSLRSFPLLFVPFSSLKCISVFATSHIYIINQLNKMKI